MLRGDCHRGQRVNGVSRPLPVLARFTSVPSASAWPLRLVQSNVPSQATNDNVARRLDRRCVVEVGVRHEPH